MLDTKSETIQEETLSPWVTLVSKTYQSATGPQVYHSFKQRDYIVTLAITQEGKIPLVKQYRPAVGRVTLELPAGLGEEGESPAMTAQRELFEETGLSSDHPLQFMGKFAADTGRMSNLIHFFFVDRAFRSSSMAWSPESGIEVVALSKKEFKDQIFKGELTHSMHLAAITLAQIHGLFAWDS